MKRVLFFFSALTGTAAAQLVTPAAYNSNVKISYVREWVPLKPFSSETDVISSSRTIQEIRQTTQYFDGLGRALQTVVKKGSMISGESAKDLVSPVLYNEYGRESIQYLPFVANSTGGNSSLSDGKFKLNPFQQDSSFNKGLFSDETYYYSRTVFEVSALNRPTEIYAAGDSWVGTAGQSSEVNRRGIKSKYRVNRVADSVRLWMVSGAISDFGNISTNAIYSAGQLMKSIIQDEHNKQVIEFKDKEGKIILKKVQLTAEPDTGTGKNHSGWLCTYYVYDELGQLRTVIQPAGVELLASSGWSMTGTLYSEQCFRYAYDFKGRMVGKKVPGSGAVYLVYDHRNRLVLTQDSIQRAGGLWMYLLYDELNRPVVSGFWTNSNTRVWHADRADTSISYPNLSGQTIEELTRSFYDDYNWRSSESNPLSSTRSTAYDSHLLGASNSTFPYAQDATVQSNMMRGLATGTKVKVIDAATYMYTIPFYDHKGRVIQTQNNNITGGTDIMISQYSWTSQPLLMIVKNERHASGTSGGGGGPTQTTVLLTKMTYDSLFRIIKTEKKIAFSKVNSGAIPGSWKIDTEIEYNALGQVKKKKLGTASLETLNYEYNIRGWTLGVNRAFVKDTTSNTNWFGFDLGYDKTTFTVNGTSHNYSAAQFNGNINGMLWRSTGDDMLRKYDFTYDAANRFLSADFNQLNSNSFSKSAGIDFSVSGMSYDANGNILSMNQKGWKLGGSLKIDSLQYGYFSGTNKLQYVYDRANDTASYLGDFKEGTNNTSQDYAYDGNGSLINDANKKITQILYNHLNLPKQIHFQGKGTISYVYSAAGVKLKKVTVDSTVSPVRTSTTIYMLGNYLNDTLQFIVTEEGRARIKSDSSEVVYDYMIKDHLGNVRMTLTEESRTDAYPAATMELSNATVEETLYDNIEYTRTDFPPGYPADTTGNSKVAVVRGNNLFGATRLEIGPGKLLRVMAGDTFHIQANSWWSSTRTNPQESYNPLGLPQLLSSISNNLVLQQSTGHSGGTLNGSTELNGSLANFLSSQTGYNTNIPKAFVNWIAFDERLNYVASGSGFEQIGASGSYTAHVISDILVKKNGYIYVYVSNETPNYPVYFDNLQVTHVRGPLVQESHYYPFGLTQKGISSEALSFGEAGNQSIRRRGFRII